MFMESGFNSPLIWDLANVISLQSMFESAINFSQPITFTNMLGVTDLSRMFSNASMFNQPVPRNIPGEGVMGKSPQLTMSTKLRAEVVVDRLENWNSERFP